jgi:hypothetical protein
VVAANRPQFTREAGYQLRAELGRYRKLGEFRSERLTALYRRIALLALYSGYKASLASYIAVSISRSIDLTILCRLFYILV